MTYGAETWTVTSEMEKKFKEMRKKDIEENIWTKVGEWTVEN